ncbi:MAG: DUF58 domain-containing protein [Chitinophagaceae bacterium]|nr:DUF58 domain-containing protein [Chitinophagaceae bacterium]MBL0056566.1 DUF58 domain-containing protein [Chitinophagaceae bacterium]
MVYWNLFFTIRFYLAGGLCIIIFVLSFFYRPLAVVSFTLLWIFILLVGIDYLFLFAIGRPPGAKRLLSDRLSNGDENKVELQLRNHQPFTVDLEIIDELPVQFQKRDWLLRHRLKGGEQKNILYNLRPAERGEYHFGRIILYAKTLLGLLMRRHNIEAGQMVPVYPSYMQMRKYELLSKTTIQTEQGNKRMRKLGHSMEFEQIKEYVRGDDIRTINWKATARKGSLMVNNYTDEKSQQVYCLIDKGRLMKMPFGGLSLLDYAINSTLVLANVCLQKQDRVGVLSFASRMGSILAADRKPIQREHILQLLYNQQTHFMESDYEMLYMQVRNRIKHRSLLVLFTNFESMSGLNRQLNYLRAMAKHHLLMVVFFENTELHQLSGLQAENLEEVYVKTIAEKFEFEKRLIVKELRKHGILSILTAPEKLTINTVNKYLELKARQAI